MRNQVDIQRADGGDTIFKHLGKILENDPLAVLNSSNELFKILHTSY